MFIRHTSGTSKTHSSNIDPSDVEALARTLGSLTDSGSSEAETRAQDAARASPRRVTEVVMRTSNGDSKLAIGHWPVFKFQPEWSPQHGPCTGKV
jgi:hypothetical protein